MKNNPNGKKSSVFFGLIFVGLLFFLNPNLAAVDVLPDFIGAFIIFFALTRLSKLSIPAADAKRAFFNLALFDIFKNILLLAAFGIGSGNEQPSMVLGVAFIGCSAGLFFAIPAFKDLFWTFECLARTEDCASLYEEAKKGKSRTELTERAFLIFLVAREALGVLPEFSALSQSSYTDDVKFRFYDYIGMFRTVSLAIAICFTVWMSVVLLRYYAVIRNSADFKEKLCGKYEAYAASHPGNFVTTSFSIAFLLMIAGVAFFTDFYIDYKNILPDLIGAILVSVGILLLKIEPKKKYPAFGFALAYGVYSVFSGKLGYAFTANYSGTDLGRSEEAVASYRAMWLSSLGEFLLFAIFLFFLLIALRTALHKEGGYRPEHIDEDFETNHRARLSEEYDGTFIRVYLFGFFSALLSFLYDYIQDIPGKGFLHLLEFLWMPDFAMAILFTAVFAGLLGDAMKEIRARYQYE